MGMSQDVGQPIAGACHSHRQDFCSPIRRWHSGEPDWRLPLARLTEQTVVDLEQLHSQFEQIRQQGSALTVEELEPGFVAIAAPVYDRERQVVAAISIGGSSLRLTPERIPAVTALVQMAARQISRQLGYWPG